MLSEILGTISLSLITLIISSITSIIISAKLKEMPFIKSKKEIEKKIEQNNYNLMELTKKSSNKSFGALNTVKYLEQMRSIFNMIYPSANFVISIKVIYYNEKNMLNSTVKDWININDKCNYLRDLKTYNIKDNTDLYSVFINKSGYFFVSDVKEYENIAGYKTENPYYMYFNTSIVYPICNKTRKEYLGFLCVNSNQKLNNSKKNEMLMRILEKTAAGFYFVLKNIYDLFR